MKSLSHYWLPFMACGIILFVASGCTLKASTETLTDATTNFVSSTTPGAWFNEDGLLRPEQRLPVFMAINYESLQQDMARGNGEHLTALASLLEVPAEHVPNFKVWSQEQFRVYFSAEHPNPKKFLTVLIEARERYRKL